MRLRILDQTKALYSKLPKARDEVFNYPLDWDELERNRVLEKVAKPWIAKKIKEYLGVEEMAMISLVVGQIAARVSPQTLLAKIEGILDEVAE